MTEHFLELHDVKKYFKLQKGSIFKKEIGTVKAVDGVTINVKKGEILGLVGESGCGKTTLGRAIIQLDQVSGGKIVLNDTVLNELSQKKLRRVRPDFQMIFQDPYASLNPRMTVFDTIAEPMFVHGFSTRKTVERDVAELMNMVGLASRYIKKFPHEFSGGQRQRIAIARALALKPKLIIADEPVSALDVSIQAQILNLLDKLTHNLGLTMIFISHDLSVVKHIADRIAVMYLGKIVEIGDAAAIFDHPKHPYTQALISAVPLPDPIKEKQRKRLILSGDPPSPINPPSGCAFHPRCQYVKEVCKGEIPPLKKCNEEQEVACVLYDE